MGKTQFVNLYGKIGSYATVKRTLLNCKFFTKFGVEVVKISLSSRQPISALFVKSKLGYLIIFRIRKADRSIKF